MRSSIWSLLAAVLWFSWVGCAPLTPAGFYDPLAGGLPPPTPLMHPNPALVPTTNRDFLWDQIVDVVDDYFRIEREERVRLVGDILTEGRIDTFPQGGATLLEPHRLDSVGDYNRLESTLQTIRRRAVVRVIPAQGGYLVEVVVMKELEDLARPEHTTAGAATFRHDSSLKGHRERIGQDPTTLGWIGQGRDLALEQQILSQIQTRFGAPVVPAPY